MERQNRAELVKFLDTLLVHTVILPAKTLLRPICQPTMPRRALPVHLHHVNRPRQQVAQQVARWLLKLRAELGQG